MLCCWLGSRNPVGRTLGKLRGGTGVTVDYIYIQLTLQPRSTTLTRMGGNSRKTTGRVDWDTTQLLDVVHYPRGSERTLAVLSSFIANKDYLKIVRGLKKEDVVKLLDVIDQVCRLFFRDPLLTMTRRTDHRTNRFKETSKSGLTKRTGFYLQYHGKTSTHDSSFKWAGKMRRDRCGLRGVHRYVAGAVQK